MALFGLFNKNRSLPSVANAAGKPYSKVSLSKREFKKWLDLPGTNAQLPSDIMQDRSRFMKTYFALTTRYIPVANTAVWIWRNLCFTDFKININSPNTLKKNLAEDEISKLSNRIFPIKSSQSGNFNKLLATWFIYIFRYGRFSGKINLTKNIDGIENFEFIDPFNIFFENKTFNPFFSDNNFTAKPLNPNTFYYYGLDSDVDNPYGSSMIESSDTLMQIANEMITDMRYSASNAGIPRLHIKISQPQILEGEDDIKYTERCNNYFDDTIAEMDELGPDDNIYTWKDVEITTVGGQSASNFVWKANLQSIQEEIISAFHLFPWLFGKQFGTTRNWVSAQFDVLMQMVRSIQTEASSFSEWIINTHLLLCGLHQVKVNITFDSPRDPAAKDMAIMEKIRLENTEKKIKLGFIDKETGAKEHGYTIAKEGK